MLLLIYHPNYNMLLSLFSCREFRLISFYGISSHILLLRFHELDGCSIFILRAKFSYSSFWMRPLLTSSRSSSTKLKFNRPKLPVVCAKYSAPRLTLSLPFLVLDNVINVMLTKLCNLCKSTVCLSWRGSVVFIEYFYNIYNETITDPDIRIEYWKSNNQRCFPFLLDLSLILWFVLSSDVATLSSIVLIIKFNPLPFEASLHRLMPMLW